MKSNIILSFLILFSSSLSVFAQEKKTITTSFWVGGVCEMCKERIEKTVDVRGVRFAKYDLNTHTLEIGYVPSKISLNSIHQLLNEVGHDTAASAASEEQYGAINSCCRYREHTRNH